MLLQMYEQRPIDFRRSLLVAQESWLEITDACCVCKPVAQKTYMCVIANGTDVFIRQHFENTVFFTKVKTLIVKELVTKYQ